MANKYLDQSGVQYLWSKIKSRDDITLQAAKKYVDDLLGMTDTDNAVVDKIAEVLEVFENYNEGKNLLDFINSKLDKAGGEISGDIIPDKDITYDLGSNAKRLSVIYADEIDATNVEASSSIRAYESIEYYNTESKSIEVLINSNGIETTKLKSTGNVIVDKILKVNGQTQLNGRLFLKATTSELQDFEENNPIYVGSIMLTKKEGDTVVSEKELELPFKNGVVALTSDIPTNYVTTDTMQTISGFKTFTDKTRFNQTVEIASILTLESKESSEYGYSGRVKAVNLYDSTSDSEYRVEIPFRDGLVALASDLAIALTTTEIDAATA